jgi:hypothetical protein
MKLCNSDQSLTAADTVNSPSPPAPKNPTPEQWQEWLTGVAGQLPEFPGVAPENDLNPSPSQLAHDIRTLEIQVQHLSNLLRQVAQAVLLICEQ